MARHPRTRTQRSPCCCCRLAFAFPKCSRGCIHNSESHGCLITSGKPVEGHQCALAGGDIGHDTLHGRQNICPFDGDGGHGALVLTLGDAVRARRQSGRLGLRGHQDQGALVNQPVARDALGLWVLHNRQLTKIRTGILQVCRQGSQASCEPRVWTWLCLSAFGPGLDEGESKAPLRINAGTSGHRLQLRPAPRVERRAGRTTSRAVAHLRARRMQGRRSRCMSGHTPARDRLSPTPHRQGRASEECRSQRHLRFMPNSPCNHRWS